MWIVHGQQHVPSLFRLESATATVLPVLAHHWQPSGILGALGQSIIHGHTPEHLHGLLGLFVNPLVCACPTQHHHLLDPILILDDCCTGKATVFAERWRVSKLWFSFIDVTGCSYVGVPSPTVILST